MNPSYDYDVVIVGAGVAGLAAGAGAARAGARTLVLDGAPEVAMKVKGEVIRSGNTIVEKVLGRPLPESIVTGTSRRRRIYSPSSKKQMLLEPEAASLVIEYRPFMHEVARACVSAGASVALNTRATELLITERGEVCGLMCVSAGKPMLVRGKAVIAADGHSSQLRQQANLPWPNVCSAYKVIVEGAKIPEPDVLEFLLLNEPAGAIWIFPKSEHSAECGLVLWDKSPDIQNADIRPVWEHHRQTHPVLVERLQGASNVLTSVDKLIFGGLLENFVRPGLVMVGDAAGQVGARGASGILSGLSMGYAAGSFLGEYVVDEGTPPGAEVMNRCMEIMKDSDTWRLLKDEEKAGTMTRAFLYETLKTNEEIDNSWDAITEAAQKQ